MNTWIVKYRLLIIISTLCLTVGALSLFPRIEVNPDLDKYIPEHIENKKYLVELDSVFGGNEMILVLFKADDVFNPSSLERIKAISQELKSLEGIQSSFSVFNAQHIRTEDGFMIMEPLIENIPHSQGELELLKTRVESNKMASRFFVDDYSLASIILMKAPACSDNLVIEDIQNVISNSPGSEEVILGGMPYVRYSISGNINKDLKLLLPMAMLLMIFMLYFSFKEWKGVFLPFTIVVISMVLSFGVMALLSWKMSLITILLPIMLIAIANDYGIHMMAHYQELARLDQGYSMSDICLKIYRDLKRPIVITSLTTIAGILGLLTHTMIPAAQLGVLAAIGIAFALFLSIWFLPAVLSYFKPVSKDNHKVMLLSPDRILQRFSSSVVRYPKRVVLISLIVSLLGVVGLSFIRVDTNVENYFLGNSDISRSIKLINNKFGGTQYLSIYIEGDVLDPALLRRMESYESQLLEDENIGSLSSPVVLFKELSKGFYNSDEEQYGQLPATADEAYQMIEMYSMSGDEEAIYQFLDYNYQTARILVSLKNASNSDVKRVLEKIESITSNDELVKYIAGQALTPMQLAEMVIDGQIKSLLFAISVVFILLSIIFRSVSAGVLSAVPLALSILVMFGLMGFLGIALDIATALLSSIMIGVGIDYTIHFIWRFKKELTATKSYPQAVEKTLMSTGRGIIFNGLSVIIGFLALTFSNFAPLRFFGGLVVVSISTCLLSALVLIPAIIVLLKPRFLNKR